MKNKTQINSVIIILFVVSGLLSGCVDRFNPEFDTSENLIVIEALMTDKPENTFIRISRSYSLDKPNESYVDADAYIEDSKNNKTFFLDETDEQGKRHIASDFSPTIGELYTLHVYINENESYTSSPVTLLQTPEIDSVYFEIKSHINSDNENERYAVVYLDTHDESNNTHFYRWDWSETYEINTFAVSYYLYENRKVRQRTPEEMINRCWLYGENNSLLIKDTRHLSKDIVSHLPLVNFPPSSIKPRVCYSIEVEQYALSAEGFRFYDQLHKISEGVGSLFDPQPTQVLGNLKNDQSPNKPVLGLFEASTISKKRVFFTARMFGDLHFASPFPPCKEIIILPDSVYYYFLKDYKLILPEGVQPTDPDKFGSFRVAPGDCSDCTRIGSKKKPDYWIN